MEDINLEELLNTATDYLASTGPMEWGIGGGGLLILIILLSMTGGKRRKKKQAKRIAPSLMISTFQVSPLGRDAYFKVFNQGQLARLSNVNIRGKGHIRVKNAVAGHELQTAESYRILLEATGNKKISKDFIIELTYMDQLGNVYRQDFPIGQQSAQQPKLIKFA
ncbi:MAG: hypothetical protein GVY26_12690 [Bacteroidetes bacterium]|jgi:hypothetical protein|nr:hypothetical protein [Bacteroidota bacterium]HKK78385.1 hypothetical protein [Phaeodactylibacter sp.]